MRSPASGPSPPPRRSPQAAAWPLGRTAGLAAAGGWAAGWVKRLTRPSGPGRAGLALSQTLQKGVASGTQTSLKYFQNIFYFPTCLLQNVQGQPQPHRDEFSEPPESAREGLTLPGRLLHKPLSFTPARGCLKPPHICPDGDQTPHASSSSFPPQGQLGSQRSPPGSLLKDTSSRGSLS